MRSPSREVILVRKTNYKALIRDNAVTILFVVLCVLSIVYSGQSLSYVAYELFGRLTRNAFIVLALIIPIVAGMGINFAITIGAMAAQIAALWVTEWQIQGLGGFAVAAAMIVPIAALFGYLIGNLLNKMKGQEMIGGMILGYFANGLYQLLFLFIFGNLIPLHTDGLVIKGSTGVANTVELKGISGTLDRIWRADFSTALYILLGIVVLYGVIQLARKSGSKKSAIAKIAAAVIAAAAYQIPAVKAIFSTVRIPMVTYFIIGLLCLFNVAIMRTRLGQQFRAVGQNMTVANASGINVDRVRVIAIMISTVLAAWGQLIFVQNFGVFQTYGAHEQVGLYAGAAILVGGASIVRATNSQAILGCILFHTLFIVAPAAGNTLFGDAGIGEYFRVFISYGVIALSLVLHGLRSMKAKNPANAIEEGSK